MRNPIQAQAGHLLWARTGTVWGVWRLQPLAYGYRPKEEKVRIRTAHTTLFRALQGESLLLGLRSMIDPVTVVERMLSGVDLAAHPTWVAECEATYDMLGEVPLGERTFWLALPLPSQGTKRVSSPFRSALLDISEQLGMPRWVPSSKEVEVAQRAAADVISSTVPGIFRPRPATTAEVLWMSEHARRRGLPEEVPPIVDEDAYIERVLTPRDPNRGQVLLDEGGQTDTDRVGRQKLNPLARRYLKIVDAAAAGEPEPSYQCMLVLDDVPAEGMLFPGSEYLARVDDCGEDVDWAVRLTVRSSDDAGRRIRRAVRDLNDQYEQREGVLSTGSHELDRAASDLKAYEQVLSADRNEVGLEATVMFLVAGESADEAQTKATALSRYLSEADYRLGQPVGAQETLWWSSQPGLPTHATVRQLAQIATASDLAASVPITNVELGDRLGIALGLNISALRPTVVHLDLEAAVTEHESSPAIAIAGSLGAGKSITLKKIAGDIVDRGGRLLTIDRTQSGEWARLAGALTQATVVDVLRPQVSLDPLRLFPGQVGARIATSFLSALLNVPATSPQGRLLSDVLDERYLADNRVSNLGQLTAHLELGTVDEQDLASYLRTFARKDLGRVVFDDSLPGLDFSSPAIVFGTAGLQLPTRDEILHEHLFRQMRMEKIFGRAWYALAMGLIRQAAFADPAEMVIVPLDEAHHVTSSPESEQEVVELIRDGRKHKAAVALGSHDPLADFGGDTLRALIPTRLVGRQDDPHLAARSLDWLGLDPEDASMIELLTRYTSPMDERTGQIPVSRRGETIMRDSRGRIGRLKVLAPALPARAQAVLTTPPKLNDIARAGV